MGSLNANFTKNECLRGYNKFPMYYLVLVERLQIKLASLQALC